MTIENVDDAMIIVNTLSENLDTDRINENAQSGGTNTQEGM